jgi:hypothetical protein
MKMVKSLLLGSAAGLVAVSAGQAADLPVKAKPVEYVKVCTLYGAGFYYIPGTDTCIKIGGFLRTEVNVHAGGSFATNIAGGNGLQLRTEANFVTRARGSLTADVREQTAYGTLRAYLAAGWQYTSEDAPTVSLPGVQAVASASTTTFVGQTPNGNLYMLRAFIQWGGFTFGKTASFYDFINTSKYSYQTNQLFQDYGGDGVFTWGYTQQLGNGFAATIALQDDSPFVHPIVQVDGGIGSTAAGDVFDILTGGASPNSNKNASTLVPDIVGSLRVDQAWGGAQVAALLHDNRATYFGDAPFSGFGHPDDKWGWAVQGGIELNLPWAKGDTVVVQSQYCVGESFSCMNTGGTRLTDIMFNLSNNNNNIGMGWADDAYFSNANCFNGVCHGASGLQLTTAWNVYAAIQHYWTPDVRTSLYGGYLNYKANSSDIDTFLCAETGQHILAPGGSTGHVFGAGCTDWTAWQIGSRTIWNPVKNLDIGVEALYTDLSKSAFGGGTIFPLTAPAPNSTFTFGSTHIWSGIMRIQYNFYP